ncbi:MAG TPA: BlaI/MecI/CopY family transcriptional regulator [Chloroflexia bacterium]|nr:BlaI/MecI/CopY family transcriptional regulator [Chloroflexia bacterium]
MNTPYDIKFRFNPSSTTSQKVLGPLECEIMEIVWAQGPTTVSVVHKNLREKKEIAYTTVMTTMSRLAKKRLLTQDTSNSTYIYGPALARQDFERYVVKGIINGLMEDYGESVVDYFVECVNERGPSSKEHLAQASNA